MRVFVTGATGFIGQPLVRELVAAGHQVLGLARSEKSSALLSSLGAEVHLGSLDDPASLAQGASVCDAVVHLAFIHDFTDYAGACATDQAAISAMGDALKGRRGALVITSGTLMMPPGRLAHEDDATDKTSPVTSLRAASETVALGLAQHGVRVCVVRLPPTNHGEGDQGFVAGLVATAKEKGVAAYVGDGGNRWPATHRLDTATVFRLALEKGEAGAVFHAVAEEGVKMKDIVAEIGKGLSVPRVSKTAEDAPQHFGFLGMVVPVDNPTSSAKTREQLGWTPVQPTLLEDLKNGVYFKA